MSNYPPPLPSGNPDVLSYAQPAHVLPFTDKRTGLKGWGITFLVLGAVTGCFSLLIPLGALLLTAVPANQTPNRGAVMVQLAFATLMYATATTLLIWIGIASIKFRRWVRPVVLTLCGMTVAVSAAGMVSLIFTAPAMGKNMSTMTITSFNPPTSQGVAQPPTYRTQVVPGAAAGMWVGIVFGIAMLAVLGIALPGAVFWFYRQPETLQTLQFFDPATSWADRAPVPVLAVALAATILMISMLFSAVQQIVLAERIADAVFVCGVALIAGFTLFITAALNFHNDRRGWMAAIVAAIVCTAGWLVLIYKIDFSGQMRSLGVTTSAVDSVRELVATQRLSQTISTVLLALATFAYLAWCRKYYTGRVFVTPQ